MAYNNSYAVQQGALLAFFTPGTSASYGRIPALVAFFNPLAGGSYQRQNGPAIMFFALQYHAYHRFVTPISINSVGAVAVRADNFVQRPVSNKGDLSGKVYNDSGLPVTLKKVQYSTSEYGPWTDATILSSDALYSFPAVGTPAGTAYNIPIDIFPAPTGNYWFRVEMECNLVTYDDVAGTFPFTAYAPVPGDVGYIVVPESTRTQAYEITWGTAVLTDYYELQEATQEDFSDAIPVYSGVVRSYSVADKPIGTYYYRVRGVNAYNVGPWLEGDNPIQVLPPDVPTTFTVPPSSRSGTYTLTWSPVAGVTVYELQEATSPAFGDAKTIYRGTNTSFIVRGRKDGTYFYRVRAGRGT